MRGERATKARHVRREPTVASSVVRGEALRQPGATAMDVLERVPGVQVTRSGARAELATAAIRGATSAQTPVYVGGIAINDEVSGTADLSTVPLWMMDRVEVFRGNSPADADRLGVGGALFFEPRMPKSNELAAGGALGSHGYNGQWALGAARAADSAALVGVRREAASNVYPYVNDQGTRFDSSDDREERRQNADYRAFDTWAIARHRVGGSARVLTLLHTYDREQGVTGLSIIPARQTRARTRRMLAGVSSIVPCSGRAGACQLELSSSLLVAQSQLSDPERELFPDTTHTASSGERVSEQLRLTQHVTDWLSIAARAQQSLELLAIDRVASTGLRARRSVSRGSLNATLEPVAGLEVHALGALECHSTSAPGSSDTCGVFEPTGRLGARLAVSPWLSVLGNVTHSVRVPTLGELFGVSSVVIGNSELVPESSKSYDLGLRLETLSDGAELASFYFDGFAFMREVSELIAYQRSSFSVVRPYNVGEARIYGVELAAGGEALHALLFETSAALLQPLDVTSDRTIVNDILPFRSRAVASSRLEVYWRHPVNSDVVDRLAAAMRVSHRSSRYADAAGTLVIPRQTTTDFELSAHFWARRIVLRCALQNVFDVRTFDTVGLPLPGRTLYASIDVSSGASPSGAAP